MLVAAGGAAHAASNKLAAKPNAVIFFMAGKFLSGFLISLYHSYSLSLSMRCESFSHDITHRSQNYAAEAPTGD
jgi:hypothetical protein